MTRPAYLRWVAALAVIAVAAYMDLSGPATEAYPFTATVSERGATVNVEWRNIPAGVLPPPGDVSGFARHRLAAGTPIVDGLLEPAVVAPSDWWAMPADLPAGAEAGREVLVAATAPDLQITGVVVSSPENGGFGGGTAGLIAVPGDHAADVAAALASGRASILIRP